MKENKKSLLSKDKVWDFMKTTGIQLLAGGIIGIFIAVIFIEQDFSLPDDYTALPFYINILIFLITYFVLIAVHELGHFFTFIRNNIDMRALFLMVFMVIKENGKWCFKFKPNKLTSTGGIAIPDVDIVQDKDDLKQVQRGFAKALIAGPIASIVFGFISSAIILPLMLVIDNIYLKSILFTILSSTVVITLFITIICFFKNEMVIGDFPAYMMARSDDFFVAMQFYQYAVFSSDFERIRSENKYLKSVLSRGLARKLEEKDLHVYTLQIIDTLLVEYLAGVSEELPEVIDQYVNFLLNNDEAFEKVKDSEQAMVLWFHIVRLLYINRSEKEKAEELFDEIKRRVKKKDPVARYLIKQTEHVLGIKDHSEYLKDKKNINTSSADGLFKNFEGYYIDEMILNRIN